SMDVEESIRANPIDGVVLLTGCDKTTPSLMMGAASCDLPSIVVSGGPMLNGKFRGQDIGSGTNVWSMSEDVRAGKMSLADFMDAEACMSRSAGHCMTMGTASTMASMAEALGMAMPTNAAIGGSTNAVVHLLALAGRVGVKLELDDWDRLGHDIPLLVNLMPSGQFLMEDFYYAGGLPAVIREMGDLIHRDALTVNGHTMGENAADAPCYNREVIATLKSPLKPHAGIAVLRGNLCPDGAVLKPSAATPKLMKHKGRAVVFENIEHFKERVDRPDLEIDENSVMVLKGAGPKGYPGFPEVGNMPIPQKLLKRGITDLVRISDARMSGTAYGTVVLHTSPEAAVGGPLALVKDGDMIELDVEKRRLHLDVADGELAKRRQAWKPPPSDYERGYARLYIDHVMQAHQGADLDFLVGKSGAKVARESH